MLRKIIIEIIPLLFIGLFIFVAASKLLDYKTFSSEVGFSPVLRSLDFQKSWGIWIAWLIPALQISIAGLLLFGYRLAGLVYSIIFIGLLTVYIIYVLGFADYVPCSCSGVLKSMTWIQHLYFNIVCMVIAFIGIKIISNKNESKPERNLLHSLKDILLVQVK